MQNSLSRQILLSVFGIAMLILALVGVSYAIFVQPTAVVDTTTSDAGDIILLSNRSTFEIDFDNLSILSDDDGKILSDGEAVMDFDVSIHLPAYSSISYELVILPFEVSTTSLSTNARFYLEKEVGDKYRAVPNTFYPISFTANGKNGILGSPSNGMTLFTATFSNDGDSAKQYLEHFRLRTWLAENTDLSIYSFDGGYKIQLYSKIW